MIERDETLPQFFAAGDTIYSADTAPVTVLCVSNLLACGVLERSLGAQGERDRYPIRLPFEQITRVEHHEKTEEWLKVTRIAILKAMEPKLFEASEGPEAGKKSARLLSLKEKKAPKETAEVSSHEHDESPMQLVDDLREEMRKSELNRLKEDKKRKQAEDKRFKELMKRERDLAEKESRFEEKVDKKFSAFAKEVKKQVAPAPKKNHPASKKKGTRGSKRRGSKQTKHRQTAKGKGKEEASSSEVSSSREEESSSGEESESSSEEQPPTRHKKRKGSHDDPSLRPKKKQRGDKQKELKKLLLNLLDDE